MGRAQGRHNDDQFPVPRDARLDAVAVVGEVHTSLLQTSTALSPEMAAELRTLRSTVSVTEGQLLQVATSTLVRKSVLDRRRPWSHYLAEPGSVELLGSGPVEAVATGFLTASHAQATLDMAAVNDHLLARPDISRRTIPARQEPRP
jgi:hypothetical protein